MKLKGLRWWIITLIFIATVINYIDRTAFALLWPEMQRPRNGQQRLCPDVERVHVYIRR